jgi:hypothetical protein
LFELLEVARKEHLFFKITKCTFEVEQIEFLGILLGTGTIQIHPSRIEAVTNWPVPTSVKHVQRFVGFANFVQKFIRDFSNVTRPLHDLTKTKGDPSGLPRPFIWTENEQFSFEYLKYLITTAPVLLIPRRELPFRVEADASDFASGAALFQKFEGKWHPCSFSSKSFNDAERNYKIYDKEMLAVMRALADYSKHLMGTPQPFEVWTDHKNLTYFMTPQKLNRRQARWVTDLSLYDNYHLVHKPGKTMTIADPLSRRHDFEEGIEDDNTDVTLLSADRLLPFNDGFYLRAITMPTKKLAFQIKSSGDLLVKKIDEIVNPVYDYEVISAI